jgi:hypothetical protein
MINDTIVKNKDNHKKILQDKLFYDFPKLYSHTAREPDKLKFDNSWFSLLHNLSEDITKYCNKNDIKIPVVSYAKSKLGNLRFVFENEVDENITKMVIVPQYGKCYQSVSAI